MKNPTFYKPVVKTLAERFRDGDPSANLAIGRKVITKIISEQIEPDNSTRDANGHTPMQIAGDGCVSLLKRRGILVALQGTPGAFYLKIDKLLALETELDAMPVIIEE